MLMRTQPVVTLALCSLAFAWNSAAADEPPVIPVGLDAYRMWERWPYQRIGARTYLRSTYDRRGGNEGADASHFLYQLADDFNVTLDVAGPGILYFARYNHWHGSPWHYEVDGVDHLVQESSTVDPNHPVDGSVFLPEAEFPNPLTWTWSITKGADLMWVPVPFEHSFRMGYSRTHYGTGYYIFTQYVRGAKLSQPIRSWNAPFPDGACIGTMNLERPSPRPSPIRWERVAEGRVRVGSWKGTEAPGREVLELIGRSGTDLVPQAGTPEGKRAGIREVSGEADVPGTGTVTVATLENGPLMVRALEFSVSREAAIDFGRARLRVTWDDRAGPSIDAPVALFFGAGTLYNRDGREFLVKAFPVSVRFDATRVHLACYFPMPFFRSARIELVGSGPAPISGIRWNLRSVPFRGARGQVGYFHATYRDHPQPEPGRDLVLLDTRETEGGGDWSGSLVGTAWIFSHRANLNTLEGDPRFFFDDSRTPQAQGTGTEEWGGGGDYWGGRNMTLPFAGHPVGARSERAAVNDEDKIESAYRFLLADLMPFGRNARIQLEHGGQDESTEHYETVTYWYGLPGPSLVQTDGLRIGDAASERAHEYVSPDASAPYAITSRYEWGVDTLNGREIFSAETDRGRKTAGVSEFTLKLDPRNFGVLLRRKLDYSFPNQRAGIYVADAGGPARRKRGRWKFAGIWYLAGGNTCVYSNPKEELGATQHIVETSNRRFRDDEFLVPRDLTEGRSAIRVRVKFTPVKVPLFPGQPLPELAWSELGYSAYCWVMPEIDASNH